MSDSQAVTFRDFAGALMGNDDARAAQVLTVLLALGEADAERATAHFRKGMESGGQAFMAKAMGLRGAVTGGDPDKTRDLVKDCFGLEGDDLDGAVADLARRYAAD